MKEEERNIKIVKDMFSAFERGDLKTIIESVSDGVEWRSPVVTDVSGPITWAKPRHGKQEVEAFFKELLEKLTPEVKPIRFTSQEDRVIVEGTDRGKANATGIGYMVEWVMVLTFVSGKVTMCYHYFDTTDVLKAMGVVLRKAA